MRSLHDAPRLPRGEFRLGEWMVQPGVDRVARNEIEVHLRARLMDVLLYLAAHAGEVVPKGEILAAVWGQKFLAESVLTRTITELRRALGDNPHHPRYIETITKRGYRLVAPVDWPAAGAGVPASRCAAFVISYAGARTQLAEGESMLGRGADATVRIDALSVSRHHARIVVSGGHAWVEDLGSKNGTAVDGRTVAGRVELTDGARIKIGPAALVLHVLGPDATTETDPSA
jgi:DNA-binding winged helix-turn-helix (wHTH) protein